MSTAQSSESLPDGIKLQDAFELPTDPNAAYPDFIDALLCAELSRAAYRPEQPEKASIQTLRAEQQRQNKRAKALGFDQAIVCSTPTQQCVIYAKPSHIVIAFEGTHGSHFSKHYRNLSSFFMTWLQDMPEFAANAKVHYGWYNELDSQTLQLSKPSLADDLVLGITGREPKTQSKNTTLWEQIHQTCTALKKQDRYQDSKLYFTGHSAGAAIATIAAAKWSFYEPDIRLDGIYSYGQPRTGNRAFVRALEEKLGNRYYRFELWKDGVPAIPPRGATNDPDGYAHTGNWFPLDREGHALMIPKGEGRTEDTAHLAGQQNGNWYQRLQEAFANMQRRRDEIVSTRSANPDPDTLALRKQLQDAGAVEAHLIRSYCRALHAYVSRNLAKEMDKQLGEQSNQDLLFHLIGLDQDLRESAPFLAKDSPQRQAVETLHHALNRTLSEWERLRENRMEYAGFNEEKSDASEGLVFGFIKRFIKSDDNPKDHGRTGAIARFIRHHTLGTQVDILHDKIQDALGALQPQGRSVAQAKPVGYLIEHLQKLDQDLSARFDKTQVASPPTICYPASQPVSERVQPAASLART